MCEDDDPETIKHRIKLYSDEINPIVNHFNKLHVPVIEVDGLGEIEEVHNRIHFAIDTLRKDDNHAH